VTDVRYTVTPPSSSFTENASILLKEESPVQVTLSDGSTIDGDAVLITVPLGVLKKSTFLLCFVSFSFFFFFFVFF
jgi:hypothetical protein